VTDIQRLFNLGGRVAVVTGGMSGIGAAVVEHLIGAGAHPVAWDLAPGGVHCDVTDPDAVAAALEETVRTAGTPSVLVTSAGIGGFGDVLGLDLDEWRHVFDVNVTGTLLCLQAVGGSMRDAGLDGSVVCITSVNARLADRGMAAYCCSKAAVDMLVRVAAAELGAHGIRVNALGPGVTDTPLFADSAGRLPALVDGIVERTALGRLGTADDVAEAAVALLGTSWVTGQTLLADGGLSLHSPIDVWGATRGR